MFSRPINGVPALAVTAVLAVSTVQAEDGNVDARIDELMRRYHALDQFNGTVLVASNDETVLAHGYGPANREWDVPNDTDTKFHIGSVTKSFTTVLIMQLIAEGEFAADTPIGDILPYYRKDTGARVTVEHLLTHTDGIPNYTASTEFWQSYENGVPYSTPEFVRRYCSGDLEFAPGADYRYGNSGYSILGAIIEEVTGQDYGHVLEQRILSPLGMHDTGEARAGVVSERRASGYEIGVDGYRPAQPVHKPLFAAGSIVSTVEDLLRYDRALYTDDILDARSKRIVFERRDGASQGRFAYGWNVGEMRLPGDGGRVRFHSTNGEINGFNAALIRLIDDGYFITLLNNSGETDLFEMISGIVSLLYGGTAAEPAPRVRDRFYRLIRERSLADAVAYYREQKELVPDDYLFFPWPLRILASQMLQDGNVDAAITLYRLNIDTHGRDAKSYEGLAEAFVRKGDTEAAIENLELSLQLNGENAYAAELLDRLRRR